MTEITATYGTKEVPLVYLTTFRKLAPLIEFVLKKYDGKKCGEKTLEKINKEFNGYVGDSCKIEFGRCVRWIKNKNGKDRAVCPASVCVGLYDTNSKGQRYVSRAFSIWNGYAEFDSMLDEDNRVVAPQEDHLYFGKWNFENQVVEEYED